MVLLDSNGVDSKVNKKENKVSKFINKIDSLFYKVEKSFLYLALLALIIMLISMLYGIASRVFFDKSILWVSDFTGYAMVYMVFFSASWLLREKGHVVVDIVTGAFSKKVLRIHSIIICIVSIVICILLFKFSFDSTLNYFNNGTVMLNTVRWPKYALMLPIVIGTFMLTIRFSIELLKSIFLRKDIFNDEIPEI